MRKKALILTMVLVAGQGSPAKAEFTTGLIDMDFKLSSKAPPQVGAALLGAAGDKWNVQSGSGDGRLAHTTGVLILADGNASNGVTLSLSDYSDGIAGGPTGFASTPFSLLMADGFLEFPGSTFAMTFNGLTAFQPYDLYLYSDLFGRDGRTTTFTIAGISNTAINLGMLNTFVEGNNYVRFGSLSADAGGHIAIAMQGSGGFDPVGGYVNGFQIAPVPEPATMALAAVGVASMFGLRSLRRRA